MKWIIENLKRERIHRNKMLGTTPPTQWNGSQKSWDLKEQEAIKDLISAEEILKKASKRQQSTEVSDNADNKALSIADVSNCAEIEKPYFDKNGKQVKEFAVIKIFHFKGVNEQGRGRKNYYMYKWVRLLEINGKKQWVALHLSDDSGGYFPLRSIANPEMVMANVEIVEQH